MNTAFLLMFFVAGMGNDQEAPSSEEMKICTMDVKECPDGSFVSRDPENNCKFKECESGLKPAVCGQEPDCEEGSKPKE